MPFRLRHRYAGYYAVGVSKKSQDKRVQSNRQMKQRQKADPGRGRDEGRWGRCDMYKVMWCSHDSAEESRLCVWSRWRFEVRE